MTHGSLFAGIGGFDLGFERAGIKTLWQVEIEDYCRKVLERHFPNAKRYAEIRECGSHNLERVDIISGGFPCQDISNAGKRAGIEGDRSGLWSEMLRIVCELRPSYVVVENVSALLGRGMGRVLGDLAESGYDAEWDCLPAAVFGAPHVRDRVFLLAYRNGQRTQGRRPKEIHRVEAFSWCQDVRGIEDLRNRSDLPEPLFRGSRDGIPDWIHRLRGLGNAIVPQIAEWIARRILNVCGYVKSSRGIDA